MLMIIARNIAIQIPYFNAPIFLENKTQVGKIEEIFGPINKAVSLSVTVTYYRD